MEEPRLDNELRKILTVYSYLWETYGYHLAFFTNDYGMYSRGFIVGLENDVCKIVFTKESKSTAEPLSEYLGEKTASFSLDQIDYSMQDGWYPLTGLIYWLSGVEYEYPKDANKDLEEISQYLRSQIDKVHELFEEPKEIDNKIEHYRNLHKETQITVEKIREERARLQALGQDSSLEAAIKNLRGGK